MHQELPQTRVAAFFDMDKTLLSGSSAVLWVRYLRERGELPWSDAVRALVVLARYKLGVLDMIEATRQFVREFAGHSEADRVAQTRQWFNEQLVEYVTEEGRNRIRGHRHLGHRVALITASPTYTAERLAEHLGLASEDVMATRFEVEDGRFTGRLLGPMVYGEGKSKAAQAYATRHDLDLQASYFYTDSIADLPLLEIVGHPVAVNPDGPLRKLALARGWSIVRFY